MGGPGIRTPKYDITIARRGYSTAQVYRNLNSLYQSYTVELTGEEALAIEKIMEKAVNRWAEEQKTPVTAKDFDFVERATNDSRDR